MSNKKDFSSYPVIIVTVYHRLAHLKQCIESLERANGVENHHIVIGSDSAAVSAHADAISDVRNYLFEKNKKNNFAKFTIVVNEKNVGQLGNIKQCNKIAQSLGHDSFILMEDDVIVGKEFLNFINDSLNEFSDDERVIAVNGYLNPMIDAKSDNAFLYNRFCAYGFASWYKKWDEVVYRIDTVNYAKITLTTNLFKKLVKYSLNSKSYPFLAERFYRAWDLEIGLMMEIEGFWVVVPPISLTANRGLDGSGLRSGTNLKLQAMEPFDGRVFVPNTKGIVNRKMEQINSKVGSLGLFIGWVIYLIYRYFPYGYGLLKGLRVLKRLRQKSWDSLS